MEKSYARPTREMKPLQLPQESAADARCQDHLRYTGLVPPENGCLGCWKYWRTV